MVDVMVNDGYRRWRAIAVAGLASLLPLISMPVLAQTTELLVAESAGLETAEAAEAVPAALQGALDLALDAANDRDLEALLDLYAPDFEHQDKLSLEDVEAAIVYLWERHPELNYAATIVDWTATEDGYEAEIVTDIEGTQDAFARTFALRGTNTVRNVYVTDPDDSDLLLLSKQTVLAETSTLTSGDAPPDVTISIPAIVSVGSVFDVEAVVNEPLGDRLLLGTALEEPISAESYLDSPPLPLQPLQAGGIFRRADAPIRPGSEWISVMLVSDGGVLIEGRRLNVVIGPVD